jgi:hypothetical protein
MSFCNPKNFQAVSSRLGPESVLCMYIGVFDARDVHIFEYAIEENESKYLVNCARAHDYVRG